MLQSFFKKKIINNISASIAILSILFFTASCTKSHYIKSHNLTLKDCENLTSFFKELLFEHGGAYTLFGDKPITIEVRNDYDEEDFNKLNEYFQNHPEIPLIQVERNIDKTWKDWQRLANNFDLTNYILAEIKPDHYGEKESLLVFINIKRTALILQKYYDYFKRTVGYDFNPIDIIFELKNGNQTFWKTVFSHYALCGILLGYGSENAWLFEWYMKNKNNPFLTNIQKKAKPSDNTDPRVKADVYIYNVPFRMPVFSCLDKEKSNKFIKKYSKKRKEIVSYYKNKNFLEVTLKKLESKD